MSPVIEVSYLGKEYVLSHQTSGRYTALRDVIADRTRAAMAASLRWFRHVDSRQDPTHESFWALREVSFTIQPGESVGIIGRNGAGKSTLLKLLSRITEPTTGRITLRGRVASLLEVGTGFHPELTGRENVFLNGVILGMSRVEVRRKFDEIVAFADVEKFLDTPVKHYSSGMYVRLAFAVAAHLEPEVLLVDEVLAVGDAGFQKKCLGKMDEVAKEGRTVLFVSHQMAMINALCQRALLLNRGRIVDDGPAAQVVGNYLSGVIEGTLARASVTFPENLGAKAQILGATIRKTGGGAFPQFDVFDPMELQVRYEVREAIQGVALNLVVKRNVDILLVSFDTDEQPALLDFRRPGVYTATVALPSPLKAGHYVIDLGLGVLNGEGVDVRREALAFEVDELSYDTSMRSYSLTRPGVMAAHLTWRTELVSSSF